MGPVFRRKTFEGETKSRDFVSPSSSFYSGMPNDQTNFHKAGTRGRIARNIF